jgi:hypothetical protein
VGVKYKKSKKPTGLAIEADWQSIGIQILTMKTKQFRTKRGGARPGAGRPKLEIAKIPALFSLDAQVVKAIAEAAEYFCTSKSKYAEDAIKSQLERDKRRLAELKRQESREARRASW